MKSFLSILALISLATPALAGDWRAAKWWGALPSKARVYYVQGLADGISMGPSFIDQEREAEKTSLNLVKLCAGMDEAGAIHALDWFYQTPQNRNIPIGVAFLYVAVAGHPELKSNAQKLLAE